MKNLGWLAVVVTVALLGLSGCGTGWGVKISDPIVQESAQIIMLTSAQIIGSEIAHDFPEIAKEMLEHAQQTDRTDLQAYWPSWKNYVTYKLVRNEHLKIVIQNLLESIDAQLEVQIPEEQEKIIRNVLEKFEQGLEDGLKGG